jgi:hypothetical protein
MLFVLKKYEEYYKTCLKIQWLTRLCSFGLYTMQPPQEDVTILSLERNFFHLNKQQKSIKCN